MRDDTAGLMHELGELMAGSSRTQDKCYLLIINAILIAEGRRIVDKSQPLSVTSARRQKRYRERNALRNAASPAHAGDLNINILRDLDLRSRQDTSRKTDPSSLSGNACESSVTQTVTPGVTRDTFDSPEGQTEYLVDGKPVVPEPSGNPGELLPTEYNPSEEDKAFHKREAIQNYRGAYERGMSEGLNRPWTMPAGTEGPLHQAIQTFSEKNRGANLLAWIHLSALRFATFMIANPEQTGFYSEGNPKGFLRWLNAGRPAKSTSTPSNGAQKRLVQPAAAVPLWKPREAV